MFLVLLPFLEIKGSIEEFWMDWDRPKPELDGDDDVDLPETPNPLAIRMVQNLLEVFDVRRKRRYGNSCKTIY